MSLSSVNLEQLEAEIATVYIPYTKQTILESKAKLKINLTDKLNISVIFNFPVNLEIEQEIKQNIINKLNSSKLSGLISQYETNIDISFKIHSYKVKEGLKRVPNVKNIIAIASGKGGVGKSTVCVNLAATLRKLGANVGILDADIYGPSIPGMLGVTKPDIPEVKQSLTPVVKYGMATMSLGYLVGDNAPAIWRGPMASGALQQLLTQTNWPELDYLIVDLPPGTGDIQLTLAQKVPVTAAIVVSTPQAVATKIAGKSIAMFNKVDIPVLGVIENMGPHICTKCGEEGAIFGANGGKKLAKDYNVELLGQLPIDYNVSNEADNGAPIVLNNDNALLLKKRYMEIAVASAVKLAKFDRDFSLALGTKVIS